MGPIFLQLSEVLEIHSDQLSRYGGSPGTRDLGLLESALGMPAATYRGVFLHSDIYSMAATYLFHIVQNHPFVDGNKRVGTVAALVFLYLNGYECTAAENELATTVLSVATGEKDKADLAKFFRGKTKRRQAF